MTLRLYRESDDSHEEEAGLGEHWEASVLRGRAGRRARHEPVSKAGLGAGTSMLPCNPTACVGRITAKCCTDRTSASVQDTLALVSCLGGDGFGPLRIGLVCPR